ncbi:MAG: adenylyltransferase/cytidyltransferase family protein [Chloroflexota bacterium]
MPKKVFVSGCFDMLHSGHVAFFEEAAKYGDLYVAIGSDRNVFELKHRPTINTEDERLYMIKSLACVKSVFVAQGSGILDFAQELKQIHPEYFIVNEDGNTPDKKNLCAKLGIEYIVLKREPHSGLMIRSTTALRRSSHIPESLTLAGGCMELPKVSQLAPGPGLTLSLLPINITASNLRRSAIELWNARLPADMPEKLAKILFGYSNLTVMRAKTVHSSLGAIGITHAGLTRADYAGDYWPEHISSLQLEQPLSFIENYLTLVPYEPIISGPQPRRNAKVSLSAAKAHADSAEDCWHAILEQDPVAMGQALRAGFEDQQSIRPSGLPVGLLERYQARSLGWNTCNLGEQAALLLISEQNLEDTTRISIRRSSD